MEADRLHPHAELTALRRIALAMLAALGLLAAVRVVQMACVEAEPAAVAQATPAVMPALPKLSEEDLALLALACPQAIETAPPPIRAAMRQVHPVQRTITPAAPKAAADEWLIDPDAWFVPEDAGFIPEEDAGAVPSLATSPGDSDHSAADSPVVESVAPQDEPAEQSAPAPRDAAAETVESLGPAPDLAITPPPLDLPPDEPAIPATPETVTEANPTMEPAVAPVDQPSVSPPAAADSLVPPQVVASPLPLPPVPESQPRPTATPLQPEATTKSPTEELPPAKPPALPPASASAAAKPPLFAVPPPAEPVAKPASNAVAPPTRMTRPTPPLPTPPQMPSPHATRARPLTAAQQKQADESHRELFAKNCYPSARECAKCHKKQYDEWRISSHAYAFVSPMFQKFEQKISELSQGTVGYFCYRCHSPVATLMGEDRANPIWNYAPVAREGVTCIACHRVNERYGKANGERRLVTGDIYDPVYGGIGGNGVARAIADKSTYKVKTSPEDKGAGQPIHREGRFFDQLSQAEFCTSCHQVAVHPGIKLEVVWEQYRASPACKKGITCQDCHMGAEIGKPSGYEITSIAEVGGKSVNEQRKHANHVFYGPNYSIAHPGIFPQHEKADRWTMPQWLLFDWRAGWGTDAFEDAVADGRLQIRFPQAWQDSDDRYDAREIIEDNLKLIGKKRAIRKEVMEHSLLVKGPFFDSQPRRHKPLRLHYDITNLNEGHNVLTASLGAQPQLWANVVLIGPQGQRLWETGYTDSDGDVCDIHSRDVRQGRAPFDYQLFNLQTMFLITGATGTDRELPLPVNVDIDQLPFLRPGTIPITTTNHPPFIRMESRSIGPLGTKRVKYKIPAHLIRQPGRYRLSFRMRNRIEPIYFMRFCEATDEMVRSMNEGILDIHTRSVEFDVW